MAQTSNIADYNHTAASSLGPTSDGVEGKYIYSSKEDIIWKADAAEPPPSCLPSKANWSMQFPGLQHCS